MQDEESLVRRAQQRDEDAFTQLYEVYFDRIYRYVAIKIGNKADAEDMTQQVFLNALQSISSFKWRGISFSAWLFRIAHNQVVDYLRKKTKQATALLEESLVNSDSNPQLVAEHKLDIEQLVSATKQLTETALEALD